MAQEIETKDYWTIIAMEACGHVPSKINPLKTKDERSVVLIYTFPGMALEDYDAWMRGEIGPKPKDGQEQSEMFDVIRKVQRSATQFKNNLHRYCR
jgi:hypothetical protein